MAKTIEISNKKQKVKVRLPIYVYPIVLILSFIISFVYTDYNYIPQKISALMGVKKDIVIYDTYTVSIRSHNEEDVEVVKDVLEEFEFNGIKRFEFVVEDADITIEHTFDKLDHPLYTSYIVPVGHVYWIKDEISREEIITDGAYSSINDSMAEITVNLLTENIDLVEDLSSELIKSEDKVGFIEIHNLTEEYKVLKLDEKYFFDNPAEWELMYMFGISEDSSEFLNEIISKEVAPLFVDKGFDTNKLTKVNMTGVTAIVRSLASKVNASGDNAYPAEHIGDFLADADLTHVSNEISFVPGCIPSDGMRFCSHPDYIEALEVSGVDIVELTGNHNNDFGSSYNASTIQTYIEKDWDYFGGGLDDTDAAKILYKEVNGTTIAFLGYNYYDTMLGTGAIATSSHAGANSYSSEKLKENITEAKENADVVIVDFQFQECYSYPASGGIYPYCYEPLKTPPQEEVFKEAVDFGADIVIGTQAHQPQTYELYGEGIIFYGLGNLYFDQIPWIGTRHGLVLSHYFYDGKYLNTQMTTTNYNKDMKTYVSEGEERELLLELLKDARD